MSSENTNGATAQPTSRWTDEEKIALLLSVIKSSSGGKITWANVDVPAGRTVGSSQKQYESLLKSAALVPMTSGKTITPTKKRAAGVAKKDSTGDGADGSPTPSKKRARKPKKAEASEATVATEDDEQGPPAKKMKTENEEGLIGEEIANFAEAGFSDV